MEKYLYIVCSKSEQEYIESLLKEPLAEKGFTLITCMVNSDPDTWEEPANAEFVALWLTPDTDAEVYQISMRRLNSGKETVNIFPEKMFITADKKRSIGRNKSVFASLHPSEIATVLCSNLPKPKPQEATLIPPATTSAELQQEVEPVQPLVSQPVEQKSPSKKEEKKFPTKKFVWIILALVVALLCYWWSQSENEEYETVQTTELDDDNHLSESQLINLIQLANKKQGVALTPSFAQTIEQYDEAPNVVWEGGLSKPDSSPELLVEQPELGDVLSVRILKQTYSSDNTQAEIVFEYFSLSNGYESAHRKAVALLYNEDGSWKIYDFGMYATNYGNQPTYYLSRHMTTYITDSNFRIQSGETFRDLNLMFKESPEEIDSMLNQVRVYARKYDVVIPDSLDWYFFVQGPEQAE